MAHMEPQYHFGHYVAIETVNGETTYLPPDVWEDVGTDGLDTPAGDVVVTEHKGVLSRLSAPGYMDCTSWTPYDSEAEARDTFTEDGIDPDTGDPVDDWAHTVLPVTLLPKGREGAE